MVADEDELHATSECNVLSQSDYTNEEEMPTEVGESVFHATAIAKGSRRYSNQVCHQPPGSTGMARNR